MKMKTCAFSGHRPQSLPWRFDETAPDCIRLKEILALQIAQLANDGYTDFLSGLALGVDTWAAQSVLALREKNPTLKLHCILSCKNQADKWSVYAQERYKIILDQADSKIYISLSYHKKCMLERNRFMVENAALLIAVYDERHKRSGTGAKVRYAQKLGRQVIIIDLISLERKGLS